MYTLPHYLVRVATDSKMRFQDAVDHTAPIAHEQANKTGEYHGLEHTRRHGFGGQSGADTG